MTFDKLLHDTECDCLERAIEDGKNLFARKINKPNPLDKDFYSHWERGKRADECKNICGYKGISVNKWDENAKSAIIKKFLITFSISPKHKDSIFVFRMIQGAGLIEHTPNKNDATHHDFYKSDEFSLEMLEKGIILLLKDFIEHE